ncbi:uncharacterized protein V1518DRAFT_376527 [Limtongia smithiae]|uniref:uncharacterized protein n=1 Tax=Limtongia smithiae TaxID=1125753 RepID=UPI0034CEBAFE
MPKEVIVLGGGVYGANIAKGLFDAATAAGKTLDLHVTLVTSRDDFLFPPVNIRNSVDDVASWYIRPYDKIFASKPSAGKVVKGTAVAIDKTAKTVRLETGASLRYDFLVIATGQIWSAPNNPPNDHDAVLRYFADLRAKISAAKSVVVIGGGSVGTELAAEIKDHYGDAKRVTLVHSERLPLTDAYVDKFRNKVRALGEELGVEFIFDARGEDRGDGTVLVTPNGGKAQQEVLAADAVFVCLSPAPNAAFAPPEWRDAAGRVRVRDTLQVHGDDAVFAAGDVNSVPETKQAAKAAKAVATVIANVTALAAGDTNARLRTYGPGMEAIALSLGTKKAIGVVPLPFFGPTLLPGFVVRKIKGPDLFSSKAIQAVGY